MEYSVVHNDVVWRLAKALDTFAMGREQAAREQERNLTIAELHREFDKHDLHGHYNLIQKLHGEDAELTSQRIEQAEREKALIETIRYGSHRAGCDYYWGKQEKNCSCGFGALKEEWRAHAISE
jgi:hypothetical protein